MCEQPIVSGSQIIFCAEDPQAPTWVSKPSLLLRVEVWIGCPVLRSRLGPPAGPPLPLKSFYPHLEPQTHTRSSLQARGLEGDSGSYSRLIIENITKHNLSNVSSDAPITKTKTSTQPKESEESEVKSQSPPARSQVHATVRDWRHPGNPQEEKKKMFQDQQCCRCALCCCCHSVFIQRRRELTEPNWVTSHDVCADRQTDKPLRAPSRAVLTASI